MSRQPVHSSPSAHSGTVREPARRVLVALENAHEEISAGYGSTVLVVRTLDGLSCSVHTGELLRLSGGVASGVRSLLHAFHGTRSRIQVERRVAAGVQLRRACIPALAERAILAGWSDGAESPCLREFVPQPHPHTRGDVVYLLRVRDGDEHGPHSAPRVSPAHERTVVNMHAWRTWAAALKRQGGAIVLACPVSADSIASSPDASAPVHTSNKQRATGRGALPSNHRVCEPHTTPSTAVRTLTLHAGRILSERAGSMPE